MQLLPHGLYTSPGTAVAGTPGSGYSSEESRGAGLSAKITQLGTQLWLHVWSRRHKRATQANPNFRKTRRFGRNAFSSLQFRTKGQALIFLRYELLICSVTQVCPSSWSKTLSCGLRWCLHYGFVQRRISLVLTSVRSSTEVVKTLFHSVSPFISSWLWGFLYLRKSVYCNENQMLPTVPGMPLCPKPQRKAEVQKRAAGWTLMCNQ